MTKLEKLQHVRGIRRDKGLCIYCGKEAIKGKSYCVKHWLENIKAASRHYTNNRQKKLAYIKAISLQRIEEGRCPKCGIIKDPDSDGNNIHCCNCSSGIHKKHYS